MQGLYRLLLISITGRASHSDENEIEAEKKEITLPNRFYGKCEFYSQWKDINSKCFSYLHEDFS